MLEYSEHELIQGCLRKESFFEEKLYKNHYNTLLKICARYVTNMIDAESLLNDSYLKIFKNLPGYEFKGSFEGWMKRITVNTCLDYLRTKEFNHSRSLVEIKDTNTNTSPHLEDDIIQQLEFNSLLKIIQELTGTMKIVFNLYIFEEYSHKEIGKELGITENTSQWYLHQARRTLKEKINATNKKIMQHT
jgi:RNA polymerase sigma factor (sigma-70 family)